jgi:hypothetical protein
VGPRFGLDCVDKKKYSLSLPRIELQYISHLFRSVVAVSTEPMKISNPFRNLSTMLDLKFSQRWLSSGI